MDLLASRYETLLRHFSRKLNEPSTEAQKRDVKMSWREPSGWWRSQNTNARNIYSLKVGFIIFLSQYSSVETFIRRKFVFLGTLFRAIRNACQTWAHSTFTINEVKLAVKSRWTKLKLMLTNDKAMEYIKRYPISSNDLAKKGAQVVKFIKAEKRDNVQKVLHSYQLEGHQKQHKRVHSTNSLPCSRQAGFQSQRYVPWSQYNLAQRTSSEVMVDQRWKSKTSKVIRTSFLCTLMIFTFISEKVCAMLKYQARVAESSLSGPLERTKLCWSTRHRDRRGEARWVLTPPGDSRSTRLMSGRADNASLMPPMTPVQSISAVDT